MRKRPRSGQHIYSVFIGTQMIYFGTSEFSARSALMDAIMRTDGALSIDLRRDCMPLLCVRVERRAVHA